jgi:hypothetical protein
MRQMEKDMFEMIMPTMGAGGVDKKNSKKGRHADIDSDDYGEEMMEEMIMSMMMGGMVPPDFGPGSSKKQKGKGKGSNDPLGELF